VTGERTVADIGKLLWPKSLAVIGASSDLHGLRGRILAIIRSHPFAGAVYPVSRSASEVQGLKAYPSVSALPEPVDLAILIVPAQYVPAEIERCGAAGIRAAVILSSGFAEESETGSRMQREIAATARRYDMAVSGPNTEGFANIAASLCPTFSPAMDKNAGPLTPSRPLGRGQVSVVSQSGGLGFAFFDRARSRNLKFQYVVTTGNEAALEVSDFVDYMLDEGATDVFLLLLEAVKTPEKFKRMAEKALKAGKPLIVGKIGQSAPGNRAVASHTAALAGSEAAYRAIFERYGLIEGRDFDEMLDLAAGFLACGDRLPVGRRVGICTASGGAGVWMADACAAAGLDVPVLDDATRAALDVHLPSYGTSQNPVDSTAQGVHKLGYAEFARLVARSPMIDGVVVVITARRSAFLESDQQKLKELTREATKPVLMWTYTLPSERSVEILNDAGYPLFTGAHGCARTMRALADYRALRERLLRSIEPTASRTPSCATVAATLAESPPVVCEYKARQLLSAYGIGSENAGQLVQSGDEAVDVAQTIGRPVALKVQSADIPHKTDAGAVALNLAGTDVVRAAYNHVVAAAKQYAPAAFIDGVLVQPMVPPGREIILGVNRDPTWGPLLMVGLGGILVEAVGDVALAPVPLDATAARALIGRLKGTQVFGRYRGLPPADTAALTDLMVRLSRFAADHADAVDTIDLNPVIVHAQGHGVSVVDALILKRDNQQTERRGAADWDNEGES
jgi:acyl-CoA synthetase (NDP forming)